MTEQNNSENGVLLIARAAEFAARAHVTQRRKGAAQEPYINHLAEVAFYLSEATGGEDAVLVAAGWLHDTLEDTDTEREELEARFGVEVASVVAEVTDDKALPKLERKRYQVEKTPSKSVRARLLKIADKTSNLHSIALSPPSGWDAERRTDYVIWAEAVVAGCRGLNLKLEQRFDEAVRQARDILGGTA
jgi:(p)ppGpp synthase/HD superfamily hydrolase